MQLAVALVEHVGLKVKVAEELRPHHLLLVAQKCNPVPQRFCSHRAVRESPSAKVVSGRQSRSSAAFEISRTLTGTSNPELENMCF